MKENKFRVIYDQLARRIEQGEWQDKGILPSEHELSVMYDTSRETVRKALNILVQNGYIQKFVGKAQYC
ncbi:GntR family transcriptional regulator [Bacillus sp. B6(2022)]|nr:GntR family transcriptional regulator [Bacillus sp. B6(2022)]